MKSKIIILLLLCANNIFAQPPVLSVTNLTNPAMDPRNDPNFLKEGNYAKDINNERDQYVGLWRYNQDGVLFELKIEKRDKFIRKYEYGGTIFSYKYRDVIIFKYHLVKNGTEIYNNLDAIIPEDYLSTALKYGIHDFVNGSLVDATHNVCGNVTIKKLTPDLISFNLASGEYYYLNPDSYYETLDEIFTIPLDGIEMEKVN